MYEYLAKAGAQKKRKCFSGATNVLQARYRLRRWSTLLDGLTANRTAKSRSPNNFSSHDKKDLQPKPFGFISERSFQYSMSAITKYFVRINVDHLNTFSPSEPGTVEHGLPVSTITEEFEQPVLKAGGRFASRIRNLYDKRRQFLINVGPFSKRDCTSSLNVTERIFWKAPKTSKLPTSNGGK